MSTAAQDRSPAVVRIACGLVAFAAGVTGMLMLAAPEPERTSQYFSWGIRPTALAALVACFYLASTVVFGLVAVRGRWSETRGLCFAVLGLSLPTLFATALDPDLFDFSRLQAIAWPALFVAAPILFGYDLYLQRGTRVEDTPAVGPGARLVFALLGGVYAALGSLLVLDPTTLDGLLPFEATRLSGRFLGSWACFLAVLAIYSLVRCRAREAWLPALALTLWPLAGVLAMVRASGALSEDARVGYLVVLLVLAGLGAAALAAVVVRLREPAGAAT